MYFSMFLLMSVSYSQKKSGLFKSCG
jgi:hypothetical protein